MRKIFYRAVFGIWAILLGSAYGCALVVHPGLTLVITGVTLLGVATGAACVMWMDDA